MERDRKLVELSKGFLQVLLGPCAIRTFLSQENWVKWQQLNNCVKVHVIIIF